MKNLLALITILLSSTIYCQTPRAGGINNLQATVLNTVHDNFVGVQTTNLNSFAVYSFGSNFDYNLGLKSTDNISEGVTNKYFSNTLARNAFSAGTGLNYSAGIYSLDSATQGTLASINNKFNTPTGTVVQYLRGDGSISNFPTIPLAQVNSDWNSNSGVSQILNKPILFSGSYTDLSNKPTIPVNTNQLINGSGFITGYTEIDPTVPSYSKTLSSFNIIKTSTDGLYQPLGSYLTKTLADTYYYPSTGNPSGFLTSLPTKSFNNSAVKTINGTGVQISTTRDAFVTYTVTHTIALTLLLASGSSQVFLEVSPNNSTWTTISQAGYSDGVAVAVALTKTTTNNVQGMIPAGNYVRLRSVVSGGGSTTFTNGQEVLN